MQSSNYSVYIRIVYFCRCLPHILVHFVLRDCGTAPIRWSIVCTISNWWLDFAIVVVVNCCMHSIESTTTTIHPEVGGVVFGLMFLLGWLLLLPLLCWWAIYWFKCSIPIEKNKRPKPNIQMMLFERARKRKRDKFDVLQNECCTGVCLHLMHFVFLSTIFVVSIHFDRSFVFVCSILKTAGPKIKRSLCFVLCI